MTLVQLGDAWVSPSAVLAVQPDSAAVSEPTTEVRLSGGQSVFVSMTVAEVLAALQAAVQAGS